MRKPVLIGGGLGLLLLAFVAGSMWMAGRAPENSPSMPVVAAPVVNSKSAGPAAPRVADTASQAQTQDRRRRLSEVRAEFNALRAQGMQAPPEKMRALVDELEAASPPGFDPRYFQALRSMLDSSAKIQALNAELQGLGKSTSPKDMARKEAILAEMRTVGESVSAEARNLQSYVPSVASAPAAPLPAPGVKTP